MRKAFVFIFTCTYCFFLFGQNDKNQKEAFSENEYYLLTSEEMPLFGDCNLDSLSKSEKRKCSNEALMEFIYSEFKFPTELRVCNFIGRVYIKWKIEKDGCISNIEFIRASHEAIEREATRVVQLMPRWIPAKLNGTPIATSYIFPLCIKLE